MLKKKPEIKLTTLKKKLWNLCRDIIRLKYANKDGTFNCYTCGAFIAEPRLAHTGHFIPSSICSTEMRYHLENLRIQDYACNIHRSGNWVEFEAHLIRDGVDVEGLKQHNRDTRGNKYDRTWYETTTHRYQTLLASLKTNGKST